MQITPPIDVKANFTFFEVTNPDDVLSGQSKPNLQGEEGKKILTVAIFSAEKGPYVFIEHREKRNLAWNGTDSIKFGAPQNHRMSYGSISVQRKISVAKSLTLGNSL